MNAKPVHDQMFTRSKQGIFIFQGTLAGLSLETESSELMIDLRITLCQGLGC